MAAARRGRGSRCRSCAVAAAVVLAPAPAQAWGFTGHRLVAEKAVRTLPDPLRRIFARQRRTTSSSRPSRPISSARDPATRTTSSTWTPMGAYPFEAISRVESENIARFGKEVTAKGRVPWKIDEVYRGLVQAFRARDLPRALERAGALCHFIADAHVPLHATDNYDGQLTGQRGLHSRWESDLVERNRAAARGGGGALGRPATCRPRGPGLRGAPGVVSSFIAGPGRRPRDGHAAGTSRRRPRTTATTTSTTRASHAREATRVAARLERRPPPPRARCGGAPGRRPAAPHSTSPTACPTCATARAPS